jgi:hypothetical protein
LLFPPEKQLLKMTYTNQSTSCPRYSPVCNKKSVGEKPADDAKWLTALQQRKVAIAHHGRTGDSRTDVLVPVQTDTRESGILFGGLPLSSPFTEGFAFS